jgi:hypothetical protein
MSTEPSRPNQLYLYELQGIHIRGSLIVYIDVPRVVYISHVNTIGVHTVGVHTIGVHTVGVHTVGVHTVGVHKS